MRRKFFGHTPDIRTPRTRGSANGRSRLFTFAKILVPVDFSAESSRALKYAATFAGQHDASITLLHVVEPIHFVCDFGYGPVTRERANDALLRSARKHLRILGQRQLGDGPKWDVIVRNGSPFSEIVNAAGGLGVDLIVMPTRGLTEAPGIALGSTAERVVRHAPCPVLTLRKERLVESNTFNRRRRQRTQRVIETKRQRR